MSDEKKPCSCYDGSGIICKEHFYGEPTPAIEGKGIVNVNCEFYENMCKKVALNSMPQIDEGRLAECIANFRLQPSYMASSKDLARYLVENKKEWMK